MKKSLLVLLTICLLVGLCIPAYATETGDDAAMDQPIQQEQEPVVVGTLEELQAAVDAAEAEDTIIIDGFIAMNDGDTLITDKNITLVRSSRLENTSGRMIEMYGAGTISGFTFIESGIGHATIYTRAEGSGEILIENCTFKAAGDNGVEMFIRANRDDMLTVRKCTFFCGNGYVLYTDFDTNVRVDSCTFQKGNYYAWLMIAAYGDMAIEGCVFGAGTGYITASLDGEITISDCEMAENYFKGRIYPNIYLENKISGAGKINIVDEPIDGEGLYNLFTGEKVELPIEQDDLSALAYMTDEQAEVYFSTEEHIGQFDIKVDERRNHFDEPEEFPDQQPDQPQPPQDDPAEPSTKPTQPPEGENEDNDNPADNPPEATEQPAEPPQGDTEDDPIVTTTTTPDTPQRPQEPADSNDGDGQEAPTHTPTWGGGKPSVIPPTKEPDTKPEPEKSVLKCGNAVLDTSKEIVLLGYGDGLLHEEDSLTRAQLATIIYRLLDEDSITKLTRQTAAFADVSPDMWCYEYVQTINAAGIVYGTGGGCYSPSGLVTWAQIATVLSRFVEPQEYTLQYINYEGWAQEAIQTAVALGWIEDSADFNPDAVISRGELVQLVNRVLELNR